MSGAQADTASGQFREYVLAMSMDELRAIRTDIPGDDGADVLEALATATLGTSVPSDIREAFMAGVRKADPATVRLVHAALAADAVEDKATAATLREAVAAVATKYGAELPAAEGDDGEGDDGDGDSDDGEKAKAAAAGDGDSDDGDEGDEGDGEEAAEGVTKLEARLDKRDALEELDTEVDKLRSKPGVAKLVREEVQAAISAGTVAPGKVAEAVQAAVQRTKRAAEAMGFSPQFGDDLEPTQTDDLRVSEGQDQSKPSPAEAVFFGT